MEEPKLVNVGRPLVTVGLCTYKRPSVLETLRSIEAQYGVEKDELEIVVVDNDLNLSGEKYVKQFSEESGISTKYFSEPQKNIAAARNKVLEHANGAWLASIDDDEIASPDWLSTLLEAANKYNADAVVGRKRAVYPENTPDWLKVGDFFNPKAAPTGTLLDSGNTGCALINLDKIRSLNLNFDLKFGLTGGSDSKLFFNLYKHGGKIVYCHEAVVDEPIEENRVNARYLTLRAVRGGQCWFRFHKPYLDAVSFIKLLIKNLVKVSLNSILLILLMPFGRASYLKPWLKIADVYGKLSVVINRSPIEIYSIVEPPKGSKES